MTHDTGANFRWCIHCHGKEYVIAADRLEVNPDGTLVFHQTKRDGEVVVHVQAADNYSAVEILSAWDGTPTHAVRIER